MSRKPLALMAEEAAIDALMLANGEDVTYSRKGETLATVEMMRGGVNHEMIAENDMALSAEGFYFVVYSDKLGLLPEENDVITDDAGRAYRVLPLNQGKCRDYPSPYKRTMRIYVKEDD